MAEINLPPALQKSVNETKVEYAQLGSSGLRVSVPILGAMALGFSKWEKYVLDEEASLAILKAAYDRGINTWDTANAYSNGLSEVVIGKAIVKFNIPRQKVIIMTKCWGFVAEESSIVSFMYGPQMERSKDYVNQGGQSA
jgi:aryl-alcohol dehydrogenase-like predicted oxidoreductase